MVLSFHEVTKSFREQRVVDCLSFQLFPGQCLGLLGPNGAGKTTTLRLGLGLIGADAGSISLLNLPMPIQANIARKRIGVVPQQDLLDPDFTVEENLSIFARYFGIDQSIVAKRMPALLEFASLQRRAKEKVTNLSGGLKRRLTLARALVNDPEVIFLDEPTTALDPQARHLIWERLQQLRDQGKTLLLTTHFMDEAQRLCDQILIVDHGRLIAQGSPRDLIEQTIGGEVLEIFGVQARQWVERFKQTEGFKQTDRDARIECSGETVFVYTKAPQSWLQALQNQSQTFQYLYRPANLEDVFLRLTGRDLRDA
jgi:lipooligosaccharide transport system ATP-binding protein